MRKIYFGILALAVAIFTGCAARTADTSGSYPSTSGGTVVADTSSRGLIPAGTQLVIRANERIDAQDARNTSRDYDAEVAEDVVNERGDLLIPRGSRARLAVYSRSEKDMALALRSVEVRGNTYNVQAADVDRSGGGMGSIGANRRTATHVGGGALLGTLIGAMAGGAKGAAVGAAVGAGAGAAVQVMTQGDRIDVPAETLLTFRLDNSIVLENYR